MKRRLLPFLLALPCFFPAIWRLATRVLTEPIGLCSDLGMGLVIFSMAWPGQRWLRALLLVFWALNQSMSMELLAAVGRLPAWQDVRFLFDPTFIENSAAGLHLAQPVFTTLLLAATAVACLVPRQRPRCKRVIGSAVVGVLLMLLANSIASRDNDSIAARYNPLHWFVTEAISRQSIIKDDSLKMADLPLSLRSLDLQGERLLGVERVKNVLIITLEGVSGIYNPEIRRQIGVPDGPFQMHKLAEATSSAMLIPDFIAHSHQTIRGLYAIHCGDISKLSSETPKGIELQLNPQRARACLPAQLSASGWSTHFLQGAPLQFMNKDKVMPAMGFQHVHGLEWFTEKRDDGFIWGTTDADFFLGARKYIRHLQRQNEPWLLSLLTVATHQPFDAPTDAEKKYGSRKIASIARLDKAVARFINGLREDGVLDETLVIITSDESHGYEGADWYSAWGFAAVLAPRQKGLPHLKSGTFGLMDIEASILDYLDLPMPPSIIGRSFFRKYAASRDMVANTSGKLRWQTADGTLYECSADGGCYVSHSAGILNPRRGQSRRDHQANARRLFAMAALLDHKLTTGLQTTTLQFADGEIRPLPETIRNEWTDNLVGAQYLNFPKNSRVDVDIRLKATSAEKNGMQLKLILRSYEKEVNDIDIPPFPAMKTGETCHIQFSFKNPEPRRAFSFHLIGQGKKSAIQLNKFEVAIHRDA